MAALAAGSLRLPTRRCAVSTRRAPVCVARSSSAHAAPAAVPQLAKASLAAGAVAAAQALSAVPALAAVRLADVAADAAAAADLTTNFRPLDYVILAAPLLVYGLFYAWREVNQPRRAAAPPSVPSPPPAVPKPAAVAPAAPPKYSGPVVKLTSGLECFNLLRTVVAEKLELQPSAITEKTGLLKDHEITSEDAFDITRACFERSGLPMVDGDVQTMRMSLFHQNLLEISHLLADKAAVPRLDAWPKAAASASSDLDFV